MAPERVSPGRIGRLSPHFAAEEFQCPHCLAAIVSPELVRVLEKVRVHLHGHLRIVSGYRCPRHNAAVGGAKNSQHMYGRAADLPPGRVYPGVADHAGAVGLGISDGFVTHLDVREGPKARWVYSANSPRSGSS